jgi:hypothetical protein
MWSATRAAWACFKARLWALAGNSRTMLVAYGLEIVGALDEARYFNWSDWFGVENGGRIAVVCGALMIGMRMVTRGALAWQAQLDKPVPPTPEPPPRKRRRKP